MPGLEVNGSVITNIYVNSCLNPVCVKLSHTYRYIFFWLSHWNNPMLGYRILHVALGYESSSLFSAMMRRFRVHLYLSYFSCQLIFTGSSSTPRRLQPHIWHVIAPVSAIRHWSQKKRKKKLSLGNEKCFAIKSYSCSHNCLRLPSITEEGSKAVLVNATEDTAKNSFPRP